jgi:hypothetical protein
MNASYYNPNLGQQNSDANRRTSIPSNGSHGNPFYNPSSGGQGFWDQSQWFPASGNQGSGNQSQRQPRSFFNNNQQGNPTYQPPQYTRPSLPGNSFYNSNQSNPTYQPPQYTRPSLPTNSFYNHHQPSGQFTSNNNNYGSSFYSTDDSNPAAIHERNMAYYTEKLQSIISQREEIERQNTEMAEDIIVAESERAAMKGIDRGVATDEMQRKFWELKMQELVQDVQREETRLSDAATSHASMQSSLRSALNRMDHTENYRNAHAGIPISQKRSSHIHPHLQRNYGALAMPKPGLWQRFKHRRRS